LPSERLYILAGASLLLLLAAIALLYRAQWRRRRLERDRMQAELMAMEREAQFMAAAEYMPYLEDPAEMARKVAELMGDFFSALTLAIYAGRDADEQIKNIFPGIDPGRVEWYRSRLAELGQESLPIKELPAWMPSGVWDQYQRPRIVKLGELISPGVHEDLLARPEAAEAALEISALSHVAILPWRGPFAWRGLIVVHAREGFDFEAIVRCYGPRSHVGDRLGLAMELSRRRAEQQRAQDDQLSLARLARSLLRSLEDQSPLNVIAREVAPFLRADSAALWQVERNNGLVRMVACCGLRSSEMLPVPLGQGLAGLIAESGQLLALSDAPSDPRCLFPAEMRDSGIVAYLGAPIKPDGQTIAVIEVHKPYRHSWTAEEISALEAVAALVSEVIRNIEARRNRLRVEGAYLSLAEALQRLHSREEIMEAAVEILGHALGISRAAVVELDKNGNPQPIRYEFRDRNTSSAIGILFPVEFVRRACSEASGGRPLAIDDSRAQSLAGAQMAAELNIISELAVPIRMSGQLSAIIYLNQCDRHREWQRDEIEFADRVGRQVSLSLTNAEILESALKRAADSARARQILDSLPEMIICLDREGRLSFFNLAARTQLGLGDEDIGRMVEMTESLALSNESLWAEVIASKSSMRTRAELLSPNPDTRKKTGDLAEPVELAPIPVEIASEPLEDGGHVVAITRLQASGKPQLSDRLIEKLQDRIAELERELSEARLAETQARTIAERAQAEESQLRAERDRAREEETRMRKLIGQLLEVNRLKSEFIANAGREMIAPLESLLALAQSLEPSPTAHKLRQLVQQLKDDVDWLIEYGSARQHQMEPGDQAAP
jgi:GAF domain-containing protein